MGLQNDMTREAYQIFVEKTSLKIYILKKKLKHTLASTKSCVPILTTVQPIAFAELRQRV